METTTTTTRNMNEQEKITLNRLEKKLIYGKGIFTSDWKKLIELREKYLLSIGEDPKLYSLGNRICCKTNSIDNIKFN